MLDSCNNQFSTLNFNPANVIFIFMNIKVIEKIKNVLEKEDKVIFAYLYGSFLNGEDFRDIDIGVYIRDTADPLSDSVDIKFNLSHELNISPDRIDLQIINKVDNLFYLGEVLSGLLIVDKNSDLRGDFIEAYSMRYREAEGVLDEAYS